MAGVAGFEPAHDEIKTRCLTAWRYPSSSHAGQGPAKEAHIFPERIVKVKQMGLKRTDFRV